MESRRAAQIMRKTAFAAPIAVASFLGALGALPAQAVVLDKPQLQVDIPGLTFSDISVDSDAHKVNIPYLAQYINAIYTYLVGIAGIVAAVMAVIGGFQYLTSGGDATRLKDAKKRITDAVVGVLLTLGAYTLLNTVSPTLVTLTGLEIPLVQGIPVPTFTELQEDPADTGSPSSGGTATGTTYCKGVADCKAKCDAGNAPASFGDNPPPSEMQTILDTVGVQGNGLKASKDVIDGLAKAGQLADSKGYYINVKSAYRPFSQQLKAVCDAIARGDTSTLGSSIAWPGGSAHGTGKAIDIQLVSKSTGGVVVGSTSCARQRSIGPDALATPEMSKLLDNIMTTAGAERYANEIWHYEFGGTGKACRCKFPNCPSPPMACKGNC